MYFPPAGGGGVQRPLKLAAHLPLAPDIDVEAGHLRQDGLAQAELATLGFERLVAAAVCDGLAMCAALSLVEKFSVADGVLELFNLGLAGVESRLLLFRQVARFAGCLGDDGAHGVYFCGARFFQ